MATYRPGAYGLDEEDPLGLKDYIAGESVPEVQERVLSARLAEMRRPSNLPAGEFDAWMRERALQAKADRANEGYPSTGIEMRQRAPEDADEAWKGREGPVPTRYSKFPTQPPVTGSVPSALVEGKAPMPARQLQQMVTGAAMPPRRPAPSPSEPDAELSPELADLVENVGKGAEDVAGKALARRPMTVTVGKPVITERVPMDAPAPTAARPGSVPGRVASAVTGGAPGELRSLLASLKGSPAAPSDVEDLAAAQRRDRVDRALGQFSDSVASMTSRTPLRLQNYGGDRAGELLTRRAAGDAQVQRDQRAQEADPASEASKAWQDTIRATLPGMAEQLGPSLGRLSAAKARELFPRLERMVERKAAADAARVAAEGKATSEAERRTFEREKFAEEKRHNLATESRRTGGARMGGAAGQKPGTVVPGMDVAPGAAPTAEDAKKVKASRAAATRMKSYVAELRDLHKQYGTEYGGAVGNRMQQLTEQIQLEGKNIAELGALSGPDLAIMQRLSQADPGGFWSNVKGMVGVDNTQTALDGLQSWVDDQVTGTSEAYGYQPKPGAQVEAPASLTVVEERAGKGGRILQKMSDGSVRVKKEG